MIKRCAACLLVLIAAVSAAAAQVHSPEKNSAERKAILDALRVPVEKELKQKIVFVVEHLNVSGTWAFVAGEPQSPTSGRPNYKGTAYWDAIEAGAFDNNFFAVLKWSGRGWKVIHYDIGCTDVCYADWWRRYKAPKAVFPYTE
jgi:hypothetical protein